MPAPTLDSSASPTFGSLAEGSSNPAGLGVAALVVDGSIADADGSPVEAIAITALNASLGTWQYRLGGSGAWLTVRADLLDSSTNELALHLGPADQLRLLPFGTLAGALPDAVTFRAWDLSNGVAAGSYAAIAASGGNTAYSTTSDTASITATAINGAPSFARRTGDGRATVTLNDGYHEGRALLLQPDGKVVIAGIADTGLGAGGVSDDAFSVLRLNADGSLDAGFGGDGKVQVFAGTPHEYAYAAALQPDGKIVVGGSALGGSGDDFVIVRLNGDGSLDTTFNGSARVSSPVGSLHDDLYAITVQPDGRILAAGSASSNGQNGFGLLRLDANGSLDTSFNGSGKAVILASSGYDNGQAVLVQPDGKIVVAGTSLDSSVGRPAFSVLRLNADGSLDSSFSGDGKVYVSMSAVRDEAHAVALQSDGKIVVAGTAVQTGAVYNFAVVRLHADGSLDTGFNGSGTRVLGLGTGYDDGYGVVVQPDGKIVVGGYSRTDDGWGYALFRLHADGSLDNAFNGNGKLVVPLAGGDEFAYTLALQPDGAILIAGQHYVGSATSLSVLRVRPDGSVDHQFGGAGALDTLGDPVVYDRGGPAVALDAQVAIHDPDLAALDGGAGNYAGAMLSLVRAGGASTQDQFGARGHLAFSGGEALLSGLAIASVSQAGGVLQLTFNSNATQARVDEALSSLSYAAGAGALPPALTIEWRFNDGNSGAQGSGGALQAVGNTPISIMATNLAPMLDGGAAPTFGTIAAGNGQPAGITVATLIVDGSITDADGSPLEAIAVTSLDTRLGAWQYQLGGSGPWLTVRADLLNSSINQLALHLGPNDKLQLLPDTALSGNLAEAVTFRAWDLSNGVAAGQYAVITATGGSTAYSSTSDTASASVSAGNTAPTFTLRSGTGTLLLGFDGSDDAYASAVQADGKLVVAGRTGGFDTDILVLRLNADGSLDGSFGNGSGKVSIPISTIQGDDTAYSVVIQPDGRIVVAGESFDDAGNGTVSGVGIARVNADGTLDAGFGNGGRLFLPNRMLVNASALQSDGKIVLAGETHNREVALLRLLADGTPDPAFGSGGLLVVPRSAANESASSVAVQPDGAIVIGGRSRAGESHSSDFLVMRLDASGTLDEGFGNDGRAVMPLGTLDDEAYALKLQPDGRIVVAGYSAVGSGSNWQISVLRLDRFGAPDTSFNGSGHVLVPADAGDSWAWGLALQGDGRIVVGGTGIDAQANEGLAVVRLNADGSLDTSFSGDGKSLTPLSSSEEAYSVQVMPDGDIVAVGRARGEDFTFDAAIVRLSASGDLDTGFGGSAANTLDGSITFVENGPAVPLDASVSVFDAELAVLDGSAGNYAGAMLTLTREGGASSDDQFGARGNLVFSGNEARLSGVTIALVSSIGGTLTLQFNANATQARIDEALSSLTYANPSDAPPDSVRIVWAFSDGNGGAQGGGGTLSALGVTTVNVSQLNDPLVGGVRIVGQASVGQLLVVASDAYDPDGPRLLHFQWQRSGVDVAGANQTEYGLTEADVGQVIAVQLRYTDALGNVETRTSAPTAAVAPALNIVDGTPEADTLQGSAGTDHLRGLDGNDVLRGSAGPDTLDGGAGLDVVTYLGSDAVTVNLAAGTAGRAGQTQALAGIEGVLGSDLADTLTGAAADVQDPFRYDDILRGRGGNDQLDGGGGVDFAEYTGVRTGYTVTRTGPASFTVQDINPGDGDDGTDTLSGMERIVFANQMLAFGDRAEELARVAFVLWTKEIVGSPALFGRGLSFFDAGYDFVTMSIVALQFWTADSDAQLAERLITNSGSAKTVTQLLQTMAAAGGSVEGRAAALREIALDAATTALIEQSGIRTAGIVADNFVPGFGQLISLLPGG